MYGYGRVYTSRRTQLCTLLTCGSISISFIQDVISLHLHFKLIEHFSRIGLVKTEKHNL